CCCSSRAEKLAWADAHGVPAPPELAEPGDEPPARKSCCSPPAAAKGSCCKRRGDSKPVPVSLLFGFNVQHCRGQVPAGLEAEVAPPPPPAVRWQYESAFAGWLTLADALASPSSLSPAEPPPRVC